MKPYILILSSIYDFSVDLITQKLYNSDQRYFRLNKEEFTNYELELDPINRTLSLSSQEINIHIEAVKSVWFRQPVFLRNTPAQSLELHEQLYRSQWHAFLRSLMIFDDASWMNCPQKTYKAESKPYQLLCAKRIGFNVPETLISNTTSHSKISTQDFVIKSMDTIFLRDSKNSYFTYTTINPINITKENTRECPITFQEYIKDKLDIRVTVIKNIVFAVAITAKGKPINDDWRLSKKEDLQYMDITLPKIIKDQCIELINILELNYGAIDLIKTRNEYYFIEINPTGEWGWLANSQRKIDETILNFLKGNL